MPEAIRARFEAYRRAPITWRPGNAQKASLFAWSDTLDEDLGPDPDGRRFEEISRRMLGGHYYPPDALAFFGLWIDESREIQAGDLILQQARVPLLGSLWAMTEVFVAARTLETCTLGYVTTRRHFGKGIWQSTLSREEGRLRLRVEAFTMPGSWLFWLGLPIARRLQMRAWRRAAEEFKTI